MQAAGRGSRLRQCSEVQRGAAPRRAPRNVPRFSGFTGVKRNYIIVKRSGVGAPGPGDPADAPAAPAAPVAPATYLPHFLLHPRPLFNAEPPLYLFIHLPSLGEPLLCGDAQVGKIRWGEEERECSPSRTGVRLLVHTGIPRRSPPMLAGKLIL